MNLITSGCTFTKETPSQLISKPPLQLSLNSSDFTKVPFKSRNYGTDDWQSTLAMNIIYAPIIRLRQKITKHLGYESLDFLQIWHPNGEAHITTITPVEFQNCLSSPKRGINFISMSEIEKIATDLHIQDSDIEIQGIGSARKIFAKRKQIDQTYFVIIKSKNLIQIRARIYQEYLNRGGVPSCWNPRKFFPHITIGYTYKDIHYPDVKKNLIGSLDRRFHLK